jgi:4'-phosphopantetheinyl transferase
VARSEVHVWVIDVDDESAVPQALNCLPPAERDRLGKRAQPHRRRALCANAALRILTAAACAGTLPLPELAPDARGRQVLRAGAPLHVSLSHAGAHAAVALSAAGAVGVDIEETEPLPDRERFARGILAAAERADWAALPEGARDTAVVRAFTRKEAVLKALGLGLEGGLRDVATGLLGGPARLRALPEHAGAPDTWTLHDLDLGFGVDPAPGLAGAVALRAPAAAVHTHRTTIAALLRTTATRAPAPAAVAAVAAGRADARGPLAAAAAVGAPAGGTRSAPAKETVR